MTWTGSNRPVAEALAGVPGVQGVYGWNAQKQSYISYRPNVPSNLNTLTTLRSGQAVWILVAAPSSWVQEL